MLLPLIIIYFYLLIEIALPNNLRLKKLLGCFKNLDNIFAVLIIWWRYKVLRDLSACKSMMLQKKQVKNRT